MAEGSNQNSSRCRFGDRVHVSINLVHWFECAFVVNGAVTFRFREALQVSRDGEHVVTRKNQGGESKPHLGTALHPARSPPALYESQHASVFGDDHATLCNNRRGSFQVDPRSGGCL